MEAYQEINLLNSSALRQLQTFLREHRQGWAQQVPDLEAFEQGLMTQLMAVGREVLASELACYDVVAEQVRINGVQCGQPMMARETYLTTAGAVQVERHCYRPAGRGTRHVCPLEVRAGIVAGYFTPAAARQAAYVTAHLPPATGAELFGELHGMQPSASGLERLPKGLSTRWEAHRPEWEAQLRTLEPVPAGAVTLAVALDGVMAPMRAAAPAPERTPDKQPKGPQGYQEVGCGTLSLYDTQGERLQTVRYARQPEKSKLTLRGQLQAEAQAVLALAPRLRLVKLSDGARAHWDYLARLDLGERVPPPETWEIVDFYHACDHLHHALTLVWGECTPKGRAEFERLKTLLKEADDGVEQVIRHLQYRRRRARGNQRTGLTKELRYFRHQRHRMAYATYLRHRLPIASGVVEAACKTLVTQRLKQSGMRWSPIGAQAILTLRSLIQSDRWAAAWDLLRHSYQQSVQVVPVSAFAALPLAA
jgi:hypothetical protein